MPDRDIQTETDRIELGRLGRSFGFLLRMAQVEVFEAFFDNLAGYGLKPGEFSVLWVIHQTPGIRQGVLAQTLRIKRPHMTKLVQTFEERGLVTRTVPDTDRRAVELHLTRAGRRFVEEREAPFFAYTETELDRLSEEEAAQLIGLLRKYIGL